MRWITRLFKRKGQDDQRIDSAVKLLEDGDLAGAADILDQCVNPHLRTQAKSVRRQVQVAQLSQVSPFAGLVGDASQTIGKYLETEIRYLRGFKGR